jgi:transcriptional regulator with XRE-family HTH domain
VQVFCYTSRMILVPRLRTLRLRAALTQRELAERAQLTPSTVHRLENKLQEVRPSTLRKLARALGVKPADLIDGAE